LILRASNGDSEAMQQVRELMPECPEIWQELGDVSRVGMFTILNRLCGTNEFTRELLYRHAESLWLEMGGRQPTGLLKICIEAVIAASLEVAHLNICYPLSDQDLTIPQQGLLVRRRDSAQRRFASAVKTYLLVKKHQPLNESLSADPSEVEKGRTVNGHAAMADPSPANGNGKHANGNGHAVNGNGNGNGYHANGTKPRRQVGTGAGNGAIPAILQNRFSHLVLDEETV
jgi:hypothetical protein